MIELEPILLEIPLDAPLRLSAAAPSLSTLPVYLVRVTADDLTSYGEALITSLPAHGTGGASRGGEEAASDCGAGACTPPDAEEAGQVKPESNEARAETAGYEPPFYGESTFVAAVDFFADTVANGRPQDYALLWQRMTALLREYRPEPAPDYAAVMGAVDMALWDLAGRALGVPCYQLAGGSRARQIDCYAGGLFADDPALFEVTKQLRKRFGAVQLSLAGEMAQDLAAVKTVRRAAGDEAPLLVDADGLYTDPEQALQIGRALEQAEVFWFQEPLPAGQWDEYRTLREAIAPALAADKHLFGLKQYARALQTGALDVAVADLRLAGGMSAGQRLADLCWLHDARVTCHCGVSPLAQLAAAHVASAHWHSGPLQVDPTNTPLWQLLTPTPVFKHGFLQVPQTPGLGALASEDFINRHRREVTMEQSEDE